jgi:guanine nucleotide-binding protein G(i) subunit alpha
MSSGGNDEGDQKKRSQMIDRGLEEDSKKLRRECKILLLGKGDASPRMRLSSYVCRAQLYVGIVANIALAGSGESGKSTIVKQMKIIHQNGYTNDELALYRHTIFKNVIDCAKALIGAMRQFDIEVENPANKQHCDFLMEHSVDPDPNANLDPRAGQAVASLWKDPCISKVFDHQNEFYLMDSAP